MKIPGLQGMSPKELVVAVAKTVVRDDVIDLAAQLAFYEVLALFPFAVFLLTVLGFLPLHGLDDELFRLLHAFMPHDAALLFESTVKGVVSEKRSGLLVVALGGAVFTASGGVSALITALDRAYEVKETRSFLRVRLLAVALTLLSVVAVGAGMAGLLLGPNFGHWVSNWFGLASIWDVGWRWARWPVVLTVMATMLAAIYWACPNVKQRFAYVTPGSLVAMLLLVAASLLFNLYASKLGNYNATYGTLGGAIVLLTWIWISAMIVLIGGVVNGVIWHASEDRDKGEKLGETQKHQPITGAKDIPERDEHATAPVAPGVPTTPTEPTPTPTSTT